MRFLDGDGSGDGGEEAGDREVEHGVAAFDGGVGIHVDGTAFGWFNAEFGEVAIGIADGRGGEPDSPTVGQFGGEGHAASATSCRADDCDIGEGLHHGYEVVGRREGGAVGEHHHGLSPHYASLFRRVVIIRVRFGEIIVAGAVFVAYRPGEYPDGSESCYQCLDIGHRPTSVVAHIENQSVGSGEVGQDGIQVAVAHPIGEARIMYVADILGEYAVGEAPGLTVVEVEIILLNHPRLVVLGIIAPPFPVIGGVERSGEVGMAVAQLVEHTGTDIKQLLAGHRRIDLLAVAVMHLVPVDILVGEETVMFVEDSPQLLEIAYRVVGKLLDIMASRQDWSRHQEDGEAQDIYGFLNGHGVSLMVSVLTQYAHSTFAPLSGSGRRGLTDSQSVTTPRTKE